MNYKRTVRKSFHSVPLISGRFEKKPFYRFIARLNTFYVLIFKFPILFWSESVTAHRYYAPEGISLFRLFSE